ncbi:hypothetical protein GCM10023336_43230 [Streptomyces similanensis]|uniref:Uncharacterized protein n=1 Tax=Streptomyces similanensis TaxID=1274988 RepID=A0ABP9KQB7_9ACTN
MRAASIEPLVTFPGAGCGAYVRTGADRTTSAAGDRGWGYGDRGTPGRRGYARRGGAIRPGRDMKEIGYISFLPVTIRSEIAFSAMHGRLTQQAPRFPSVFIAAPPQPPRLRPA